MHYCCFENTLADLRECYKAMEETEFLSEWEAVARKKLIALCKQIAEDCQRKEIQTMTFLPHLYHCNNCDGDLTEDNIRLALEDAGEEPDIISLPDQDHYTLFCPTYREHRKNAKAYCLGYRDMDKDKPAYWEYR